MGAPLFLGCVPQCGMGCAITKTQDTHNKRNIANNVITKGAIMSATTFTKQKSQVTVNDISKGSVSTEIDKVIIGSAAAFTGIVGLWSFACLASAMYQAGGPVKLAVGYVNAFVGM